MCVWGAIHATFYIHGGTLVAVTDSHMHSNIGRNRHRHTHEHRGERTTAAVRGLEVFNVEMGWGRAVFGASHHDACVSVCHCVCLSYS